MKWLFLASFLAILYRCEGSAIRCTEGNKDGPCPVETIDYTPVSPVEVGSDKDEPHAECLAGTEWDSNCHYCRCSDSGVAECLKQDTCDSGVYSEPLQCKPNTTFVRDCNTCVCLQNGLALCTVQYCRRSGIPKKSELPAGKQCAPGSSWKSSCSDCKCSDTGYTTCSPITCDDDKEIPMRCAPDTMWKNDCNTCWCTSEGRAMCTRIGCVGLSLNFDKDDKINDKDLIGPITKTANAKEVVCVANRMFIRDCNTCWCNEDGTSFFCTRKVCIPELPDETNPDEEKPEGLRTILKECRPDEVFELDCNMCRCNPDGKSFSCTRRACVEQEDVKNSTLVRRRRANAQEPPKACQPGAEFRLDCNKCLCDNEGQDFSCTRIDCNALNNNNNNGRSKREISDLDEISSECAPGSVFERDCNACRCTSDGHHAMCSTKNCHEETKSNHVDSEEHGSESDPGFRCNPGEQFKRNCNDCTCSADGKSYFCTLRLCDEFIASGV